MRTPQSHEAAERRQLPASRTAPVLMSIAEMRAAFGATVRELRVWVGRSDVEAAEFMRMSPSRLQEIERGEVDVSLDDVVCIAEGLGVPVEALFAGL